MIRLHRYVPIELKRSKSIPLVYRLSKIRLATKCLFANRGHYYQVLTNNCHFSLEDVVNCMARSMRRNGVARMRSQLPNFVSQFLQLAQVTNGPTITADVLFLLHSAYRFVDETKPLRDATDNYVVTHSRLSTVVWYQRFVLGEGHEVKAKQKYASRVGIRITWTDYFKESDERTVLLAHRGFLAHDVNNIIRDETKMSVRHNFTVLYDTFCHGLTAREREDESRLVYVIDGVQRAVGLYPIPGLATYVLGKKYHPYRADETAFMKFINRWTTAYNEEYVESLRT